MIRNLTIAALAVCLAWPVCSKAQETAPRTRPRVRVEAGPYSVFAFGESRGRIGVIVDTRANAANDKVGARIEGVTPGGPAEKAGLKVGDVITRFNGTALAGAKAEDVEDSGPGMKLIDLAHDLDPGDTVQVEYKRGTDSRKATIVAEDLGGGGVWAGPGGPGLRWKSEDMVPMMGGPEMSFPRMFMGTPWGGIELVKLNPDLGDYFGTREGVLVVSAPRDSSLALKGGDVILTIDNRKPSSPEQAMKILGTYESGDSVAINVMRKQKRVTVKWIVPDNNDRYFRMMPRMHEEPSSLRALPQIRLRDVVRTKKI